MVRLVSVVLACRMAAGLVLAARSALAERGGGRLVAAGLMAYGALVLAGAVVALGQ